MTRCKCCGCHVLGTRDPEFVDGPAGRPLPASEVDAGDVGMMIEINVKLMRQRLCIVCWFGWFAKGRAPQPPVTILASGTGPRP